MWYDIAMPLARPTTPPTDAEHEAEVAQQTLIESEVVPEAALAPEAVAEAGATAKITSVNVESYPIHVAVVGGEYTFTDASTSFDVPLAVAEQFTYVPVIEVAV